MRHSTAHRVHRPRHVSGSKPAQSCSADARTARRISPLGYIGRALLVLAIGLPIIFVLAVRFHLRPVLDQIKQFNKRFLNPVTLTFAGLPGSSYAIVRHVGRRSGHEYSTPVVAEATDGGFIIPLPYGTDVDWCRNVLAEGTFTIQKNGADFAVGQPEVVDRPAAMALLPGPAASVFSFFGIQHFLKVTQLVPTATEMTAVDAQ